MAFRRTVPSEPESGGPTPGDEYLGPVCFREGFYYRILFSEPDVEIGPDIDNPLIWDQEAGVHRFAHPTDPSHFHTYGLNPVEVTPIPDAVVEE